MSWEKDKAKTKRFDIYISQSVINISMQRLVLYLEEENNYEVTLEMFYLSNIEQLFLFVEQLDQLEVCLPYSRLLVRSLSTL